MVHSTESESATRAPVAQAADSLSALLEPLRHEIDRVLEQMPDTRLESRRLITLKWGLDPTPNELRTIVHVAHHPAGRGTQRELARLTVTLRILVDRELRRLLDGTQLDAERIGQVADLVPVLIEAADEVEDRIHVAAELAEPGDREFLLQVGTALLPSRDSLTAAEVLAPRLRLLATATGSDQVRSLAPTMDEQDFAVLDAAARLCYQPEASHDGPGPSPVSVTALVLRAVIEDDLAEWNRVLSENRDPRGEEGLTERLKRGRTAYRAVARRLQNQQNDAVVAGLEGHAQTLRRIQSSLFAAYRRLTLALNPEADAELTIRPVEASLDLDAARHDEAPAIEPVDLPKPYDLKRERRRIRILSSIAGVLFLACAAIWIPRMSGGYEDVLEVPLDELSGTLILSDATSVGAMMYAVVSADSWDGLTTEERLRRVEALGLSARNKGYGTVYLVDEDRAQLATWSAGDGAKLVTAPVVEP